MVVEEELLALLLVGQEDLVVVMVQMEILVYLVMPLVLNQVIQHYHLP
jgi:hypothetical protein